MKTLDEIAKAVVAIFPKQETSSGLEAQTHRVETTPSEGNPNSLDVLIVQVFPPPAKRFELRIEKTEAGWLAHPTTAPDSYMAQAVAMRLQRSTVGEYGPPVTSSRNDAGLFAVAFVTEVATEELPAPPPAPTGGTLAAPDELPAPEPKYKKSKEPLALEASV